jgi:hypothetical protein
LGLFGDCADYVDFFHLQDLVDDAKPTVKFFMPFEGFFPWPLPQTFLRTSCSRTHCRVH